MSKAITLNDLLKGVNSNVFRLFDLMDIAEGEIQHFQKRHPAHKPDLFDAFMTIVPTHNMTQLNHKLYIEHCRELLERVVAGEDLRKATKAEMCAVFANTSMIAPIHGNAVYLYAKLFEDVFGEQPWSDMVELRENYDGASDYWLTELETKAGNPDRHQPNPERWHKLNKPQSAQLELPLVDRN